MTNTFNLADYAPKGRAEFNEQEYDSDAEKRIAAMAEYDELALKADQDFGLIPDDFKSEPEHVEVDEGLKMPLDVSQPVPLSTPPPCRCVWSLRDSKHRRHVT